MSRGRTVLRRGRSPGTCLWCLTCRGGHACRRRLWVGVHLNFWFSHAFPWPARFCFSRPRLRVFAKIDRLAFPLVFLPLLV